MKRRIAAKNQTKDIIIDPWKPLHGSANGTWHLIAMKAYELYEKRGREDGHALKDWLTAESIVKGETE